MNSVIQVNFRSSVTWESPDFGLLENRASVAPQFPTEMLGDFWADWVGATAQAANAPSDYVAAALLTAAGAAIGNSRVARVGAWKEPPVLWTVLVGEPSMNKSPALDSISRMFDELQQAVHQPDILLHDATPRATADAAEQAPKGNLLMRDEIAGWWASFGAAGGEQFWLQSYGARPHTIRRVGKPPILIPRLAVSVLGGTQPVAAQSVLHQRNASGFASRLLYIAPSNRPVFSLQEPVNDILAEDALHRLFALPVSGSPQPCDLATEAERDLESWVRAKQSEADDEPNEVVRQWIGKQRGAALRLALIREHLIWAAEAPHDEGAPQTISQDSYRVACRFIDSYAQPMMVRALAASSLPPEMQGALRLAQLLRKHGVESFNAARVRRSELGPVGDLRDAKTMKAACDVLEAACLIRHVGVRAGTTSGRQPQDYAVNPALLRS